MICPKCGFESPETANFCPKCGQKLERKSFCYACGAELIPDMPFCAACGAKVGSSPAPQQETPVQPVVNNAPVQEVLHAAEFDEANAAEPIHYDTVWFVEGERKLKNSPWFVELDVFSDSLEYRKKFSPGNVLTGGLGAIATSSVKAKKMEPIRIYFASIKSLTFSKDAKIDAQKLIHIYTKDGGQYHFAVQTPHYKETEPLFQRILSLAQPYMK